MKTFASTSLMVLMALSVAAQQPSLAAIPMQGAPDVKILGTFIRGSDDTGRPIFSIDVRNVGTQTVKAVTWDYYLTVPSETATVEIRVTATTPGLTLRPGEKQTLQVVVPKYILDPVVSSVRPSKIRLTKVAYEAGTSWSLQAD